MPNSLSLNITQNLTNTLGLAIVRGEYEGALPSEAEICNEYGVSRSSTREAVKMLSAKGLIRSRPKQGIRIQPERFWNMFDSEVLKWILVSKPTLGLLREFLEVRIVVEPQAAALAASNADAVSLQQLSDAMERFREADTGLDDPLEADIAFHDALFNATGNRFFLQLIDFVTTALRVTIRYSHKIPDIETPSAQMYEQLYKAIAKGDSDKASSIMKQSLTQLMAAVVAAE